MDVVMNYSTKQIVLGDHEVFYENAPAVVFSFTTGEGNKQVCQMSVPLFKAPVTPEAMRLRAENLVKLGADVGVTGLTIYHIKIVNDHQDPKGDHWTGCFAVGPGDVLDENPVGMIGVRKVEKK
jgi:hypothetical protein